MLGAALGALFELWVGVHLEFQGEWAQEVWVCWGERTVVIVTLYIMP